MNALFDLLQDWFRPKASGDGPAFDVESVLYDIVEQTRMHDWDENHISHTLMQRLRELFTNYQVNFNGWKKFVHWQSFKNRGAIETQNGDIALVLNIQFSTNESLRGVALLEAKRQYPNGQFSAMGQTQIDRVLHNAPYSQALLYYPTPLQWPIKWPGSQEWSSPMWVAPLNTLAPFLRQLSLSDNNKVQRIALPFSMFLTARAFWGHDLDYREQLYDDILAANTPPDLPEMPGYLAVIDVYYEGQRRRPVVIGDGWERI